MKKPRTRVEIVARALCRHDGVPENTTFKGRPMWESYIPAAKAVLSALDEETDVAGTA